MSARHCGQFRHQRHRRLLSWQAAVSQLENRLVVPSRDQISCSVSLTQNYAVGLGLSSGCVTVLMRHQGRFVCFLVSVDNSLMRFRRGVNVGIGLVGYDLPEFWQLLCLLSKDLQIGPSFRWVARQNV